LNDGLCGYPRQPQEKTKMNIELILDWSWWQYLLAAIGIIYAAGAVFFLTKGVGIIFALIWPLFYLFGGINVQ